MTSVFPWSWPGGLLKYKNISVSRRSNCLKFSEDFRPINCFPIGRTEEEEDISWELNLTVTLDSPHLMRAIWVTQ